MLQTFLFTFRPNGEAHGLPLTEVRVQQLAEHDASVSEDAYRRSWFGTEEALRPMLADLGFAPMDIDGVSAALGSHRETERNFATHPDDLHKAGFQQVA
jgi:hypothetical protein